METDPVCGMDVGRMDAAETAEYDGEMYYFCSKACRDAFDRDPEKYAGLPSKGGRGW